MGGRAGGGASGGMGSRSRNSDGRFVGTGGEVFYNGPGSKGWNNAVKEALSQGLAGMKNDVYIWGDIDRGTSYTVLAGVAAKSTGFQKDIATKGLKNLYNNIGNNKGTGLSEKQSWAVVYEFKKLFG